MVETSRIKYWIFLSAAVQLALGAFTAHQYDGRVFLAAGYSVVHGKSPYMQTDVSNVFGASIFPEPVPGIGYPPPWSFVLALAYLVSYNLFPNLILYNLATKLPIVIGNILLALLVGRMVLSETSSSILSQTATRFMLFNPYVVYSTAIWGQFDTVSVLLMLLALFALSRSRPRLSAVALGGAIALKLIPVILLPLAVLYEIRRRGWARALQYFLFVVGVVGLSFSPFVLGWDFKTIIDNWNIHFVRVGAFSPMDILLAFGINDLANGLALLGYLWIPALAIVYYLLWKSWSAKPVDLILSALAVLLGVFLTRSWVSEQNLNFVVPLVLLASLPQGWSKRWVTAVWVLPLVFTFLHSSPLLLFFLVIPEPVLRAASLDHLRFGVASPEGMLITMAWIAIAMAWLVIGLKLLRKSLRACSLPVPPNLDTDTGPDP